MQIWIYFLPGTGGDGIANLLEHSQNVTTIDHNLCVHATPDMQFWRVDRFVDNRPKFWAPTIDHLNCFRQNQKFDKTKNYLSISYINLINSNATTIITSHDCSLKNFYNSDCVDIFTKNQIKILLYSNNIELVMQQSLEKNLIPYNRNFIVNNLLSKLPTKSNKFDFVADIDTLLSSWDQFNIFAKSIELVLDKQFFDDFCFIRSGHYRKGLYSDTTPRYETVIADNGDVTYKKL